MTQIKTGFDAVVFDAYGTLFDVYSVGKRCDTLFPGRGAALSQLWRAKQIEYTWLVSLMGRYEDFAAVTRRALNMACASLDLALDEAAGDDLMATYNALTPYPEVASTLDAFAGAKLAILSNGSPPMLEAVVAHNNMADRFDAVLSVDPLQIYKPHPSVYRYAEDTLRELRERVLFVSSNGWDAAGAAAFGFRAVWVNRAGAAVERLPATPWRVVGTLADVPALLHC